MKRVLFSVTIMLCCALVISGCIKHPKNSLTINPTMTATIGTATFNAVSVAPATIDSQINDTSHTLVITGNASLLQSTPGDQIILSINGYKNAAGTFSLIKGQTTETYIHKGHVSVGTSGIISITSITGNSIIGYFQFTTSDGLYVSNGSFSVGKP